MDRPEDDAELRQARRHVEQKPTDLRSRFELGRALAVRNQHRDAIPQLQKARQNPTCRLAALRLLADCHDALGQTAERDATRRMIESESWREQDNPPDDGNGGAASPAPLRPITPATPGAERDWPGPDES